MFVKIVIKNNRLIKQSCTEESNITILSLMLWIVSVTHLISTPWFPRYFDRNKPKSDLKKFPWITSPTIIMLWRYPWEIFLGSDFGLFYQVPRNQGLLYSVTDTIDTYVFRALMKNGDVGLSSAAAFYQSIVCFITIIVFNAIIRKMSKEDLLLFKERGLLNERT